MRLAKRPFLGLLFLLMGYVLHAQTGPFRTRNFGGQSGSQNNSISYDRNGRPVRSTPGSDSLKTRNSLADSITIFYRYFDSTRNRTIDSSINDFYSRFPLPYQYHSLGNYGTAAQPLLFTPYMRPGFDAGFHAYDIYQFTIQQTKFYQTTRPYTELAYLLGSKAEQLINVLHTQNRKDNFNFSLEYRFSNAPGNVKNQNASHNNFRFTSQYRSPNRKYGLFFILLSNKAASSENGGLQNVKRLDSLSLNDPYELETRLGRSGAASRNPFNTGVNTGNIYKESTILIRHFYDFGKKDSVVTDSTSYKIFYPRFRLEHTLRYSSNSYQFIDNAVDSFLYERYFNRLVRNRVNISYNDRWTNITNQFSMLTFPDKNNQSQFIKAGIALQNLSGRFDSVLRKNAYNIYALGEYRNRTRNQVWDIEARGELYLNGFNAGDYEAWISMKRLLGRKAGYLNVGFHNVNRSPSFLFDPLSRFPINNRTNFGKENTIHLFLNYENPKNGLRVSGNYYVMNNYIYFDSFFHAKQEATLFNVIHVSLEKRFKLARYWNWYTEVHVQQKTGQSPVNIPSLLTRNRIAFEGNFFTNLFLSTGLEIRYHTAYKADGYSPFVGRYFYQNTETISNRPDINLFLHFRIKSFKGFVRFENLNTLNTAKGFEFSKLNMVSSLYPSLGLWTRVGIWWNFIN
jgi:hypothetical protein